MVTPIVATVVSLLLHVPPPASLKVAVEPTQILVGQAINPGNAFTVTLCLATQPGLMEKVIVAVPVLIPVSNPDDKPILATPTLLLLHVPPPDGSFNNVVAPKQILNTPDMGRGGLTTFTNWVALHPEPSA